MRTSKKLKKGEKYLFQWDDTYSQSGWYNESEIEGITYNDTQETIGIFVRETDRWYVVAAHKNSHPSFKGWGNIDFLPIGAVRKIVRLT